MKNNIINKLFLAMIMIFGIISCEDREMITIDNQGAPIVVDLSTDHLFLDQNFPENPALTVSWQSAQYSVPTEIKYRVESSGNQEFSEPNILATVTSSERAASFTVNQINTAAINSGLTPGTEGKMYIRVVSFLGNDALSSISNVTSINVTPYVLSYPSFYLVGAASYVGWNEKGAQILYKKDNYSYIYTYMQPENFRFLGQQDWNPINYSLDDPEIKENYRYFKAWSSILAPETSEKENIKFTGTAGVYKIVINADPKVKSIEVLPSAITNYNVADLYLVGNIAGNGWNEKDPVPMTKTADGVFEYTTTLAADTEFKLLGQKSWGDLEWGNILKDNTGFTGFLGPKGDNGNIKFEGNGGSYKITVNLKAGIITIQ